MIGVIARHELRTHLVGLPFWLTLGLGQLILAWLCFAQYAVFSELAPQLIAGQSRLGAMELVIAPTLNSAALLILLVAPLFGMGSLAGEARSGRLALWLAAPVSSGAIVLGKLLGTWLAALALPVSAMITVASLGLGVALDWPRLGAAAVGLGLLSLIASSLSLWLSSLTRQPIAALTASYGLLIFLWLLDSLTPGDSAWRVVALNPHLGAWFGGLIRGQDLAYFIFASGGMAALTVLRLGHLRGETG